MMPLAYLKMALRSESQHKMPEIEAGKLLQSIPAPVTKSTLLVTTNHKCTRIQNQKDAISG